MSQDANEQHFFLSFPIRTCILLDTPGKFDVPSPKIQIFIGYDRSAHSTPMREPTASGRSVSPIRNLLKHSLFGRGFPRSTTAESNRERRSYREARKRGGFYDRDFFFSFTARHWRVSVSGLESLEEEEEERQTKKEEVEARSCPRGTREETDPSSRASSIALGYSGCARRQVMQEDERETS